MLLLLTKLIDAIRGSPSNEDARDEVACRAEGGGVAVEVVEEAGAEFCRIYNRACVSLWVYCGVLLLPCMHVERTRRV